MGEKMRKKELIEKLNELIAFVEQHGENGISSDFDRLIDYEELLYTDSLSGLGNRASFSMRTKNYEDRPNVACIILDLNNLKICNDEYGHREGDKLICDCAECISASFGDIGTCFRVGGDEFAVLCENADADKIEGALNKLSELVEKKNQNRVMNLSIAYGYAIRQAGESMEQLINRSDSCMYEMKYRMKMESPVFTREKIVNYLKVLDILSRSTDDFLFLYDIDENRLRLFGDVESKYGLANNSDEELTLEDILGVTHIDDRNTIKRNLLLVANGRKKTYDVNHRWITKDGDTVWLNCRAMAICDEKGIPHVMIGRVSEEAVRHLFNPLTGLFNKIQMMPDLKRKLSENPGGYLVVTDVDDLAAINLSHGRSYGDSLVKRIVEEFETQDETERIYHIDNSCFAVWIDAKDEVEAYSVFTRVQNAMSDRCTLSAGIAPIDNNVFEDEIKLCDSAKIIWRQAKESGKGAVKFYTHEEISDKIHSVALLEELHESVKNDYEGFFINYQPQLKSGSYEIYGVEALARYKSKEGVMVFPDEFIPLLEQSRLIEKVGLWVLEKSLLKCSTWRKWIPDLKVSVNFSTIQFKDEDIVSKILEILARTHMPGDALTIEITESIQLEEIDHFAAIIRKLKKKGINIAIDDFGTGYSNIGYLKQLDIDEVKIDKMFVRNIQADTYNYKLIRNTIELAKTNDIRVCCEGVETKEELVVLEQLSPDSMQGYLFDRPANEEYIKKAYCISDSEEYQKRRALIEELYAYKEKMGFVYFSSKDILRETNVGLWVIRYNPERDKYYLYADDTMERIMGVNKKYAPEECYSYWFNRVNNDQKEYVSTNMKHMRESDKVIQLQYRWTHPEKGEITVRSSGRRADDSDGMIVIEGYHRILSEIEEV